MPGNAKIVLATVDMVGDNEATIILPDSTVPTQAAYKFAVGGMHVSHGDRVYAIKISGTYVLLGGYVSSGGDPGATFTPSVSAEGVISWTNNGGLPNPAPVNIKGPPGPKGGGMYAFEIRPDGHLWCIYDTAEPPAFSINAAGHLIYSF